MVIFKTFGPTYSAYIWSIHVRFDKRLTYLKVCPDFFSKSLCPDHLINLTFFMLSRSVRHVKSQGQEPKNFFYLLQAQREKLLVSSL